MSAWILDAVLIGGAIVGCVTLMGKYYGKPPKDDKDQDDKKGE